MLPSIQSAGNCSVGIADVRNGLNSAFANFTEAAGALEQSYGLLQAEVFKLRAKLEKTSGELEREREASQKAQALAEVATVLAHEIRNPLTSVELFAGLLSSAPELGVDSRHLVANIQAGVRLVAATVNNVLQFHGDACSELIPTNLASLLHMTVAFLQPLAKQSGVELEVEERLGESSVLADPHRLQQVLLNLAMNAIRLMPDGGTLTFKGIRKDDTARRIAELHACDTGPGIRPENRVRIFEPGFTTRPGSPGLGLAVCKKIVEQHGGSIELVPSECGATFVLRFPLVA